MTHIGINAHLLSSQAGYRSAGIHTYLHSLLTHLPAVAPADWRFTAMIGGANPANYAGITTRRARLDTEAPLKRIIWEQLMQPFQLGSYDLLHAGAFVAPALLTKPMVVTVYDLTFVRYPERLTRARRLYLQSFTAQTCQRARRILAISHSTKQDLVDLLGIDADKIDVTPLGYDRKVYRPLPESEIAAFRRSKNLPERFWFYLGTLEPRKNLVTLIDAYAQLPATERLPLVLAGGRGWQTDAIFDAIARSGAQDQIHLPGFIPTEEIASWYNAAEVFLYPSVFEGFGLPVLEAMACGTPVITSNVSSLPEVAEGAGWCLPPADVDLWTDALRRVYHDAAWRTSARSDGLKKAEQFRWEETARLTINSYQRALTE
jgi:glycosyltransferase involved in cell wall biosynthesis